MNITDRNTWGAHPVRGRVALRDPHEGWYWHWNGTPVPNLASIAAECQFMRDTQNWHMHGKGWDDIAYGYVVFQSGRIYEGRGWDTQGAATQGKNSVSVALMFAIGTGQVPSRDALAAAEWLVTLGFDKGKVPALVKPHNAARPTQCPGPDLVDYINRRGSQAPQLAQYDAARDAWYEQEVQMVLHDAGFLPESGIDGVIGPETVDAVHHLKNAYLALKGE